MSDMRANDTIRGEALSIPPEPSDKGTLYLVGTYSSDLAATEQYSLPMQRPLSLQFASCD